MNFLIPLIIYVVVNAIVAIVFFIDKYKAVFDKWRIPEGTLIFLSIFGPVGATIAMLLARHKIRKTKFLLVYVFLIIHVILIAYLFYSGALTI